jgi:aminobenzoyl-glutamate utilization protein B
MIRRTNWLLATSLLGLVTVGSVRSNGLAAEPHLRPTQQTALAEVAHRADELKAINKFIWEAAEVGLQEHRSSAKLIESLAAAGFEVQKNIAGMPTAFVASYGSGKPIIGILAEYDALPGMSQKAAPQREAVTAGAPGHACGHSALGSGAVGAALAVKAAMEKHNLPGTIRLYGTPAEETVIGKIYMALAGAFSDLDVCLHWHPGSQNGAWAGSSKAVVSAKFSFSGTPSHASVGPDEGRSALDAVELMNVGANYMREHIQEDARIHYVITDGGGAPNVVPPTATVWYFVRADDHRDVEKNFAWLNEIAQGAALMTQTKVAVQIDTDCHEIIINGPLAECIAKNLERIAPPTFTAEEEAFARRLQEPLVEQFGKRFPQAFDIEVERLAAVPVASKGSTDVGDVSWQVPTGGLRTTCFPAGSPGHSWQNVASIGTTIGEKGLIYAAQVLACTALDLIERPELVSAARADWQQQMEGRKYTSLIPPGQRAPVKIR